MPMSDPATMTSTEICSVTTTPCNSRGSSSITVCIGTPSSYGPSNPPLEEAEQRRESISRRQVKDGRRGPRLDELERVGHELTRDEGQFGNGDGDGQGSVLEERDERVTEGRQDRPRHDGQGDVPGNLEPAEAEGAACLDKGAADAKDAGPKHFGQVGSAVDGERGDRGVLAVQDQDIGEIAGERRKRPHGNTEIEKKEDQEQR